MDALVDVSTSNDASEPVPTLGVLCETDGPACEQQQVTSVVVTGSHDLFIRYEAPSEADAGSVARIRAIGADAYALQGIVSHKRGEDGQQTLVIGASKSKLELVLLREARLQHISSEGSGDVIAEDGVLVTSGPSLALDSVGSGDVYISSSAALEVEKLTVTQNGSARLQLAFGELQVSSVYIESTSSSALVLSAGSESHVKAFKVVSRGSASMCVTAASSMDVDQLEINNMDSGNVAVGPVGSCAQAELSITGSGGIDIGGMQCDTAEANVLGSGDVVVQATHSLSGSIYGSGHVWYAGNTPASIGSGGKQASWLRVEEDPFATPVKTSYTPVQCKQHPVPLLPVSGTVDSLQPVAAKTPIAVGASDNTASSAVASAGSTTDTNLQIGMNSIPLAVIALMMAFVLRWFNDSRRRARPQEHEREWQPLLGSQVRPQY